MILLLQRFLDFQERRGDTKEAVEGNAKQAVLEGRAAVGSPSSTMTCFRNYESSVPDAEAQHASEVGSRRMPPWQRRLQASLESLWEEALKDIWRAVHRHKSTNDRPDV